MQRFSRLTGFLEREREERHTGKSNQKKNMCKTLNIQKFYFTLEFDLIFYRSDQKRGWVSWVDPYKIP